MNVNLASIGTILAIIALVVTIVLAIMGQFALPLAGVLILLALARLLP